MSDAKAVAAKTAKMLSTLPKEERHNAVESLRRLSAYLAWFKWHESFKHDRNGRDMAELAVRQVNDGVYDTVWRGYRSTPYPFFDYWEKLAC